MLPRGIICIIQKIIHIVITIIFYIQHTIHTEIIEKIDEKGMNFSGGLVRDIIIYSIYIGSYT